MTDHPYPPGTLVTRVAGPLAGTPFIVIHSKPAQYAGEETHLYYVEGCDSNRHAAYTSGAVRPWGGDIDMLSTDAQHRVRMLRQSAVMVMPVSRRDLETIIQLTNGDGLAPDPYARRFLMRLFDELESLQYYTDRDIETEEEMHAWTD